jgi:hypothetical protein
MKSLLIAMLVLVPLYTFAQDAKMPAEAKKVIDKYEASVEVARKAFDAAVAKAREQALKDLKPIQTTETKKGNLDGAMLVKAKVDELTSEIPKPAAEGDLAKPAPPSTDTRVTTLSGKWKVTVPGGTYTGIWEFRVDGTVTQGGKLVGKYAFEKNKIIITWDDGGIDTLRQSKPGASVMEGSNSKGVQLKFEKLEENK